MTETPWTETPPDRDPTDREPLDRDPRLNRITDRRKNITLPVITFHKIKGTRMVISIVLHAFMDDINDITRRHPWEIQRLVSTYPFLGGGGYSGPTQIQSPSIWPSFHFPWEGALPWINSNPKSLNLAKFSFSLGGGITVDQLKSKVPQSGQVFRGRGVGGSLDKLKSKSLNMAKFQLGVVGYSGQTQIKTP